MLHTVVELFSRAFHQADLEAEIGEIEFDVANENDPILILVILLWVCAVDAIMALYLHRQPQRWRKTPDQVENETMHGIFEEEAVQVRASCAVHIINTYSRTNLLCGVELFSSIPQAHSARTRE